MSPSSKRPVKLCKQTNQLKRYCIFLNIRYFHFIFVRPCIHCGCHLSYVKHDTSWLGKWFKIRREFRHLVLLPRGGGGSHWLIYTGMLKGYKGVFSSYLIYQWVGFCPRPKAPNLAKLGVFWKIWPKKHPICSKLGVFCFKIIDLSLKTIWIL